MASPVTLDTSTSKDKTPAEIAAKEPWNHDVTVVRSYNDNKFIAYFINIQLKIAPTNIEQKDKYSCDFKAKGHKWTLDFYPKKKNNAEYFYFTFAAAQHVKVFVIEDETVTAHQTTPEFAIANLNKKWIDYKATLPTPPPETPVTTQQENSPTKDVKPKLPETPDPFKYSISIQFLISQTTPLTDLPTTLRYTPWKTHDIINHLYSKPHDIELIGDNWSCFAHKKVLSKVSSVFDTMFKCNMRESSENEVEIEDINDAQVFQELLHFIYTGLINYDSEDILYQLCQVTHKYSIDCLKSALDHQLSLYRTVDNCCDKFVLSYLCNLNITKKYFTDFIVENYKAVVETKGWEKLIKNTDCILYISKALASKK